MEHSVRPIGSFAFEDVNFSKALPQLIENVDAPLIQTSQKNDQFPEIEVLKMESISRLQLRKALIYYELLEKVEEAVALESEELQKNWYSTKRLQRDDAFLNKIAKKLRYTDVQVDYIFLMATSL
jgi:hypothetical protein